MKYNFEKRLHYIFICLEINHYLLALEIIMYFDKYLEASSRNPSIRSHSQPPFCSTVFSIQSLKPATLVNTLGI